MTEWVEEFLGPYVATAPAGIVPLLLLDDFRVHKTGPVVRAIQELGVQVEFIPPGCTGMVQPVDVGYNKALKSNFCVQYRVIGCFSRTLTCQFHAPIADKSRHGYSQQRAL